MVQIVNHQNCNQPRSRGTRGVFSQSTREAFQWTIFWFPLLTVLTLYPCRFLEGQPRTLMPIGLNLATAGQQTEQGLTVLRVGQTITRTISGEETHQYTVQLLAGQFLNAVLTQRGVDVIVIVYGPGAQKLIEVDSPNGKYGPEPLMIVANTSGAYSLKVFALEKNAPSGSYELLVKEVRYATTRDKISAEAQAVSIRAQRLFVNGTSAAKRAALSEYEKALTLWRAANNIQAEAQTLNIIGQLYYDLNESARALAILNQALGLLTKLRDPAIEAETLNNLGAIYDLRGEWQKAIVSYDRALKIRQETHDTKGQASTLSNRGTVYASLGQLDRALADFDIALRIRRASEDRYEEAVILANVASIYDSIGEKRLALSKYNEALLRFRELGDHLAEAIVLSNIGALYSELGDKPKALELLMSALPRIRAMRDQFGEARVLNSLGSVYDSQREKGKAIQYFEQALLLERKTNNRPALAMTLANLGTTYNSIGQRAKAIDVLNQALLVIQELKDSRREAYLLNKLGEVYNSLGDGQTALRYFNRSILLHQKTRDRSGQATAFGNAGLAYETSGSDAKALDSYETAISILESLRSDVKIEDVRSDISTQLISTYQRAILLCMKLNQPVQAFNFSERARARTFLDQLGTPRSNKLDKDEQSLRSEINALQQRLISLRSRSIASQDVGVISSLESQLDIKQREYDDLFTNLQLSNTRYTSRTEPLTLTQVQELLDNETTLLSYFVLRDETVIFVITKHSFQAVQVGVRDSEIGRAITQFRTFEDLQNAFPPSAKELHSWLIAPVKRYLSTRVIGIVPNGILNYLPFGALTDGQQYLLEEYSLFYLPSATVYKVIRQNGKRGGMSLFAMAPNAIQGFPQLPYAAQEVKDIVASYPGQAFIGSSATESVFRAQAGKNDIVHIAAHSQLNVNHPLFSSVLLAADSKEDGILTVADIYQMHLTKTRLVVLSGSETVLGKQVIGDDILGLTRAFMFAGATSVIATLWCVDDQSNALLMASFYKHLKERASPRDALRSAQLEMRVKYKHPYYWAGVILTGDPSDMSAP